MEKKVWIKVLAAALIAAVVFSFAGCSSLSETDVSYAGPMLDNVLTGIKDNNYAEFTKDMDDAMKKALPEDTFHSMVATFQEKIGDYQSKTFGAAAPATENNVAYTKVIYKAKYTKETGDVLITISFTDSNGTKKVSGLLFSSPNLLKK